MAGTQAVGHITTTVKSRVNECTHTACLLNGASFLYSYSSGPSLGMVLPTVEWANSQSRQFPKDITTGQPALVIL